LIECGVSASAVIALPVRGNSRNLEMHSLWEFPFRLFGLPLFECQFEVAQLGLTGSPLPYLSGSFLELLFFATEFLTDSFPRSLFSHGGKE
jgi:hypothetical protein